MTQVELKDLLVSRVGWKQPTGSPFTLSGAATTSDSGRYFQDEYPMVTLGNIHAVMEQENANDTQFSAYLVDLTNRACMLVVADVFEAEEIDDDFLTNRETIFDNCISKRMAILVGEIIINSTRSNAIERITKEQQQQIFFELNGNADSSSSRANPNFPTYIGLKSRYGACIERVKDLTSNEKALDTYTFRVPDYDDQKDVPLL